MRNPLPESLFYMWRAIFAIAHADDVVTDEERVVLTRILETELFSDDQIAVLKRDMTEPQDIVEIFSHITEQDDRSLFFKKARELVWADGDYGQREQDIIMKLQSQHVRMADFDTLNRHNAIELVKKEVVPDYIGSETSPIQPGFADWLKSKLAGLFQK